MRTSLKTSAFVLKKTSLPNKDAIVTLFTKEKGKLRCFAKGIKKITSRRLPHIQTGNYIQTVIQNHNEKYYLNESVLISAFSKIKEDGQKYRYVYIFLFVIERLLPEEEKEEDVFQLLTRFFVHLSDAKVFSDNDLFSYINSLILILGYEEKSSSAEQLLLLVEGLINEKIPQISI